MQINKLVFAGFVGKDATDHTTQSGTRIVSFSLCHTSKGRNGGKDISTWVRVKVFGNWCDSAILIKKGDNVIVDGSLNVSDFLKDGVKNTIVEMTANSLGVIKKLEKAKEEEVNFYEEIPF